LIIEGPAESGLAQQMALALPGTLLICVQSVPSNQLAALIGQCRAFVGNDSGIAHLAAGLGVASVVLFGPTLPKHWSPLGRYVKVLRDTRGCEACASAQGEHTCMSNIPVEEVLRALPLA